MHTGLSSQKDPVVGYKSIRCAMNHHSSATLSMKYSLLYLQDPERGAVAMAASMVLAAPSTKKEVDQKLEPYQENEGKYWELEPYQKELEHAKVCHD